MDAQIQGTERTSFLHSQHYDASIPCIRHVVESDVGDDCVTDVISPCGCEKPTMCARVQLTCEPEKAKKALQSGNHERHAALHIFKDRRDPAVFSMGVPRAPVRLRVRRYVHALTTRLSERIVSVEGESSCMLSCIVGDFTRH